MKIDFSAVMTDLRGKEELKEEGHPVKLGLIAVNALMVPDPEARAAEKIRRITLAAEIDMAMESGAIVDLKSEDVTHLKALIDKAYPYPLIVGQALARIEGEPWPPKTSAFAAAA